MKKIIREEKLSSTIRPSKVQQTLKCCMDFQVQYLHNIDLKARVLEVDWKFIFILPKVDLVFDMVYYS